MTNSEARDLMAQNSHDVTILEGEEADAINVVNMRGNGEVIIGDSDNQIMVLDSASTQKSMPMDGIEILEDKDIRILDSKSLDDRFVDGISFLSQSKIDDLILGPKPLSIDGGVTVNDHEDEGEYCFQIFVFLNLFACSPLPLFEFSFSFSHRRAFESTRVDEHTQPQKRYFHAVDHISALDIVPVNEKSSTLVDLERYAPVSEEQHKLSRRSQYSRQFDDGRSSFRVRVKDKITFRFRRS